MSLAWGIASALAKRSVSRSKSAGSEMVRGLLTATGIPPYVRSSFIQPSQSCQVPWLNQTTTMAYNAVGQPVSVTDPLGHLSTLEYDDLGNTS